MEQKKIIVNVTDFVNKEIDAALRTLAASNVQFVKYKILTVRLGVAKENIAIEVTFEHEDIEKIPASTLPIQVKFTVSDTIRLYPISEYGENIISRFGQWWKVPPTACGKWGERYLMQNLPHQMQGKFKGSVLGKGSIHIQELRKENDPHFVVIDVCAFPKAFMHQQYKL